MSAGADTGQSVMAYSAKLVMRLVLFGLAAGDDDRGSTQDEHDTGHVEDRGTDATGGGKFSTLIVNDGRILHQVGSKEDIAISAGSRLNGIVNASAFSIKQLYAMHNTNLLARNLRYHIAGRDIDLAIEETISN